jgi:hypothetical protein
MRMAPDHAEHIETLKQIGLNSVWVPDSNDQDRAKSLYEAGIAVMATPPHPEFEPGDYTRLLQSLPPLDQQYPHVSAWLTGTRVSPDGAASSSRMVSAKFVVLTESISDFRWLM